MKASESKVPINTLLLAGILDRLSLILWQRTKDGQRNRNRPKSISDQLLGKNKDNHSKSERSFESVSDFDKERERILNLITGG